MSHRGHSVFDRRGHPFLRQRRVRPVGFESGQAALDREISERLGINPAGGNFESTAKRESSVEDRVKRTNEGRT